MRWLLALATASFVAYFAFTAFSVHMTREAAGVYFEFRNNQTFLSRIVPDSPADRAGLEAGDHVLAITGIPLRRVLDQRVAVANFPVGAPTVWEVERNGQRVTIEMERLGRQWQATAAGVVFTLSMGLSLLLGIVLAWRRTEDRSALLGAWLLASLSVVMAPLMPRSFAASWRELPTPLGLLMWPAAISSLLTTPLLLAFFARVPRPVLSTRALALAIVPAGLLAIFVARWLTLAVYDPQGATQLPAPRWLMVAGPLLAPLYFIGAIALLLVNLRRLDDVNERRRARVLLVGMIAGAIALVPIAATLAGEQMSSSFGFVVNPATLSSTIALFSILPLSLTYATVRHRLFDLRIIMRLGLQYALARGLLLALLPIAAIALVVDLLLHGDQPLRAILAERGWAYLLLSGLALAAYTQRGKWMAVLDRRFFRERYLAQQVLRQVVDDVARSRALDEAAGRVLTKIESALHPRVAALLVREPAAQQFAYIATTPAQTLPPLPADSAIVRIARALARPLVLDTEGRGLRRDLPADDQAWLTRTGIELIVPVAVTDNVREVLLALGPRLSEEPYTAEDLELLSAIAASLALIDRSDSTRERAGLPRRAERPGKLAARYRLERLIGEGGMGSVWEGVDELLDRPVAVKLLKEEVTADSEALQRFRREAQSAARLSHHNIVVVHDFGIDAQRPFLVMERLVGRTLRQRLIAEHRLSAGDAVEMMAGTAAGIDAAHAQKLAHRDLKPENIFLCAGGAKPHVKILDFGIARDTGVSTTSANTSSGAVAGTFLYMGPEQLAGGTPSPAWDIWALAVIAYEMLSGAHPLQQPCVATPLTPFDWAQALASRRLTPIAAHVPDAPPAWSAFFERALALDADRRPATALQLATEFRVALGLLDGDERAGGTPVPSPVN